MMSRIGIHFSHELHAPSRLLHFARTAERVGFRQAMLADFSWSWLGAAMHAAQLMFSIRTTFSDRNPPASFAREAATVAEMFPNRLWIVAQASADNQASPSDRNARLKECVLRMREYWPNHVDHDRARENPTHPRAYTIPQVFVFAETEETARWAGSWADGLVITSHSAMELRGKIDAFRGAAGNKPVYVQSPMSFALTESAAIDTAKRNWPLVSASFGEAAIEGLRISSNVQQHIDWIHSDLEAGATRVYLNHIGPDMETFIESFGALALPEFENWKLTSSF